jgi:HK97 family phage portal protein
VASLFRTSPENPSTNLSNPAGWLYEALGASQAKVTVNEKTAMNFSAVWASVRILSETIGSLPLHVYQLDGGIRRVSDTHPTAELLNRPNGMMTPMVMKETMMAHLCLHGNAYIAIERNNAGKPVKLIPIHPSRVTVTVEDGEKVFIVDERETYLDFEMIHIPGLSFDGIQGISPIAAARDTFGLGLAANKFGKAFFENGANVGATLKHPGRLSDDAYKRLKNSWESRYSGLGNSHKTAILEEGMTVEKTIIPPDQAQFLQTRRFQVEEVARWFLIPPHMLGDLSQSSTRANIEEQGIAFVRNTIRPWAVRIEEEFNSKLLGRGDKSYFIQFNIDGLLRGDLSSRYKAYAVARQWGWMSVNDIRAKENLNPLDNGDIYLTPLNMVEAGNQNTPNDE